jgi:hypothetical protein
MHDEITISNFFSFFYTERAFLFARTIIGLRRILDKTYRCMASNVSYGRKASLFLLSIEATNNHLSSQSIEQVGGFLQTLWFPPPITLTTTI